MTGLPKILGLALVAGALAGPAPAADPQVWGKSTRVVKHLDVKLKPGQRDVYRWLTSDKSYFGAMVIDRVEDKAMASRHFHSLETVREVVLARCRLQTPGDPDRCVLYASVLPRELPPDTRKATGLGRDAAIAFKGRYAATRKPGLHGAFAISGMSDYGWATEQTSAAEARGKAVALCEAAAQRDSATFPNVVRRWIGKRGLAKCRVIHTQNP